MSDLAAKVIGWLLCSAAAAAMTQTDSMFLSLWFFFFTTCVAYELGNHLAEFIKRQFQR